MASHEGLRLCYLLPSSAEGNEPGFLAQDKQILRVLKCAHSATLLSTGVSRFIFSSEENSHLRTSHLLYFLSKEKKLCVYIYRSKTPKPHHVPQYIILGCKVFAIICLFPRDSFAFVSYSQQSVIVLVGTIITHHTMTAPRGCDFVTAQ